MQEVNQISIYKAAQKYKVTRQCIHDMKISFQYYYNYLINLK